MIDGFARFRQDGTFVPTSWAYYSNTVPNGQFGTGFDTGTKRIMHDVVTRGFRKRSASGEVIMSPMYRSEQTKQVVTSSLGAGYKSGVSGSYWRYEVGPDTAWCLGVGSGISLIGSIPMLHSGTDVENHVTLAATECRSNRNAGSSNNWENIAEIDKTYNLLRHPVDSWFGFSRKARVAQLAVNAANGWLVWRYGVRPLILSVEETLKSVRELAEEAARSRKTTRGKSEGSLVTSSPFTIGSSSTGLFSGSLVKSETVEVRAMSIDDIEFGAFTAYGFTGKDLLNLPYELIPYSFVIDWFANVGSFLRATSDYLWPHPLGSCYVTTISQGVVKANSSHTGTSFVPTTPMICAASETCVTKYRQRGLPAPGLVIKPDFRLDNPERIADALALVWQQCSRFFLPSTSRRDFLPS